eukprot:2466078-Prymnesium_polylepis.1
MLDVTSRSPGAPVRCQAHSLLIGFLSARRPKAIKRRHTSSTVASASDVRMPRTASDKSPASALPTAPFGDVAPSVSRPPPPSPPFDVAVQTRSARSPYGQEGRSTASATNSPQDESQILPRAQPTGCCRMGGTRRCAWSAS